MTSSGFAGRWFSALTTKKLQQSAHRTAKALAADIQAWIDTWNDDPKPFVWHKTAEEILDRLAAPRSCSTPPVALAVGRDRRRCPAGTRPRHDRRGSLETRYHLRTAPAAVGEAIKFVPAGTDAVPRRSLWSRTAREVYEADPGRFMRGQLEVVQRTYCEQAEHFTD